jgi:phage terminase large subunit
MKRYKINITRRSTNTIKEFRNYKWAVDSTGKTLNVPVDFFNHSIDPIRYVILNKVNTGSGKYSFL